MKCLEKNQSYRFQNIEEFLISLNSINGYEKNDYSAFHEEIVDSPTMVIPKLTKDINDNDEEKKIVEVNLIDENSDKAFRSFFSDKDDIEENKKLRRLKK